RIFNSHHVNYYNYCNTVSYFIRLPDGKLASLENGVPYYTKDSSTVYESWLDFTTTIKEIIISESYGINDVWINTSEPDNSLNPCDHSDHRSTGRAVLEATSDLYCNKVLYEGYSIYGSCGNKTPNLSNETVMHKAGLFIAYDKSIWDTINYCTVCESLGYHYVQWLFRTYISRIISSDDTLSVINETDTDILSSLYIIQNYPNPFNTSTIISFTIPKKQFISLKVFDSIGREIEILLHEQKDAGKYKVSFNSNNLSSGIYFCRLEAGNSSRVKKIIVLK
ncbi:MAG: T9SS type A sorting domain-containing protein, partial [Candidatus Helarchaeota archaeon]